MTYILLKANPFPASRTLQPVSAVGYGHEIASKVRPNFKGQGTLSGSTIDNGPPVAGTVKVYWESPTSGDLFLVNQASATELGQWSVTELDQVKSYIVRGSFPDRRDVLAQNITPGP